MKWSLLFERVINIESIPCSRRIVPPSRSTRLPSLVLGIRILKVDFNGLVKDEVHKLEDEDLKPLQPTKEMWRLLGDVRPFSKLVVVSN